jgi:hypothetical protein
MKLSGAVLCAAFVSCAAFAQVPRGNFLGQTERPLRYFPEGTDFVITNGSEFFNRPLYCDNSAFRVDGGDKPEFSLYVPGRGGNLRLGIKTEQGIKWLNDADKIIARYRAGSLDYVIRDPLLMGNRELRLTALPMSRTKGFIVRAQLNGVWMPIELIWAFGGANGMRGRRNGDIGCESEPVSSFFQLRPEQCRSNEFTVETNTFILRSRFATIGGVASPGATHIVADASDWENPAKLCASAGENVSLPVVVGRLPIPHNQPVFLAIEQFDSDSQSLDANSLEKSFLTAEQARRDVANRVIVETPDPFINAAASVLNVAADAIWDERQQSFMHGAVAWRQRLLGWRGPYAGDALGWHERTAAHFIGFAKQQNTNPVPHKIPPADEDANLARSENALHSNGDMTRSHYDMNLVAVDAFFRHLLWTGDLDFARTNWSVIDRHLAWERRLFRREFGEDKLPLYEAYAAIWASDNLNYNGGGVTHASAYNYWHNKMAARVAKLIGKDSAPYEREAELILRGMKKYLWLAEEGNFAEFKDYLGLQLAHPNAGLWTFYHTMDSEVPTPAEAAQMSRWLDKNIARIPVLPRAAKNERGESRGEGKLVNDSGEFPFVLSETSWMPYQWSLNNVVVAENMHTSLGYWQANRRDTAFGLFKGTLLDTMFMGLCPGNLGAMLQHDVMRGESQRDFGDGIGTTSRALVEGLFGMRPDALAGELKIVPGFPAEWNQVRMTHPDFDFSFRRDGTTETFSVTQRFPKPMSLRFQIPMLRSDVADVTVNGRPVKWRTMDELVGEKRVEITCVPSAATEVRVHWRGGEAIAKSTWSAPDRRADLEIGAPFDWNARLSPVTKLETLDLSSVFNDRVTQIFRNEYRSPRSPFCSLAMPKQGIGGWADNRIQFDVDDSGLRAAATRGGGKFVLPNGIPFATPTNSAAKNIAFVSQWDNYPREVTVPLFGKSGRAFLLMAGSTGPMQSQFDNGEVIVTYADGSTDRMALRNPTNWWPIDQDYFVDDFGFRRNGPIPPRVDLKTGQVRILDAYTFKGRGGKIPGGAATVLDLPLDQNKELKSLTVRALSNEVVIGLMALTLER